MPVAFIGVGSNLGNRVENCLKALQELSEFAAISRVSSLYETEPVGKEDQPPFVNCVIEIATELSPSGLLVSLQAVEERLGRRRTEKWGPRIIDLDIIFYDDKVIETPELIIPHPRAHERKFVLVPLSEIAPDLLHPVLDISVSRLLAELGDDKLVEKIGDLSTAYSHKFTIYPPS